MIEINNVIKKYGEATVLNQVSIEIPRGAITSFIGPNGAGKSTLMSIISRIIPKDGGKVLIEGLELDQWNNNALARKVSILKQSNHTNLRLTVRDLVSFGRFPYSNGNLTETGWDKVNEAIKYMNLTEIQDKYLHQLSGGQRQRAYIAMVIAQDTDYILLDEPLNNLDMKHSVEIMKILRSLVADKGKTIVLVIHDINFASCYSDYIVAMNEGRLVKVGKTDQIICKEVLCGIYDLDFQIRTVNNNKICVYY